jgi:hypothetical protein
VVGEFECVLALGLSEELSDDPPNLLEFHFSRALALQRAHHRPSQAPVGQFLPLNAVQFHEKESAVRDEGGCPFGDFRWNPDQIPKAAHSRPLARPRENHNGNHERKHSASFDFSPMILPDQADVFHHAPGHNPCRAGLVFEKDIKADRLFGYLDLVKDILPALGQGDVDSGNLLDLERRPIDQRQKLGRHPRFEELTGNKRQGHRMAENAVVGLWEFLLGHAPDNGRTAQWETSSTCH